MKMLFSFVLLSAAALAQNAPDAKVVTFNRSDTEHCRVVTAGAKPLLESTSNGTSVAVGMPENRGNGEFAVFVAVYQAGGGAAHVNPKEFWALYSDAAHTRLAFYDKAAEVEAQNPTGPPVAGMSAETNQLDRSMIRGGPPQGGAAGLSPSDTIHGDNPPSRAEAPTGVEKGPPAPATTAATTMVFLRHTTVKPGARAAGWVFFRKPKSASVDPNAMLGEIDIPINGVVFRF